MPAKRKMIVIEVEAQSGVTNAQLKREYGADHWCNCHLVTCVQIQVNDVTPKRAAKGKK